MWGICKGFEKKAQALCSENTTRCRHIVMFARFCSDLEKSLSLLSPLSLFVNSRYFLNML